ncbi:MAG TPA: potassium transporter TrkG [Polyangiaceae bacterium]
MTEEPLERQTARGRDRLRPHATTSGILLAAAAAPFAIVHGTTGSLLSAPRLLQGGAAGVGVLLLLAAVTILRRPPLGRTLATLGLLGGGVLGLPHWLGSPLATLSALIVGTFALMSLWKVGAPLVELERVQRRPVREGQAQGAAVTALALWMLWTFMGFERCLVGILTVGWAVAWSVFLGLEWAFSKLAIHRVRAVAVIASLAAAAALTPVLSQTWWWMMSVFVGSAATVALVARGAPQLEMERTTWWEPLLGHPERLFVGTFAALCLGGMALLALPQSATSGQSIGFVDAAFTSTSAVCVTGLVVLDTPVDFSAFGQFVIVLLIQVGGLGIMTFSTAALWALGRRMSLRHEGAVASLISPQDRGRLFATAKRILRLTIVVEGAGTILLTAAFVAEGDSVAMALWRGVFTSISAFCNAGFALQSDSLVPYQHSPLILHTVGALIVLGGLSPLAVFALPAVLRRSPAPVSAQARLALSAASVLLVGGFLFVLAFEWNDSLRPLDIGAKVHNAWFQSVTLRTAGFNSVDITLVRPATLILMLLWMFVGGSPGSTAGGVKTTTVSVLALSVLQAMRGQWTLEAFGKRIPERTRAKAAVVVSIAALTGLMALVAVLLTQNMPTRMAVFEVVSALGTVGLSIGGTGELDGIGKTIIIVCMFVGRVGGLTLLMFLRERRAPPTLGRPEEELDVG